jgi:hypothetical protein
MKRWWGLGAGLCVLVFAGVIYADARDDLSSARHDFEAIQSRTDAAKDHLSAYLEKSVRLRALDTDQLIDLINQICNLDIERDGDDAERLAKDMSDKAVERVRDGYDHAVDDGSHAFDELSGIESDAKSLRDRVHDLQDNNDVADDAAKLHDDLDKLVDKLDRMFDRLNADRRTLDNVKNGVMNGTNNPTIRARIEYGKEMHHRMQSDRGCDESETSLSSGRPDCIKFDQDDCKVIEFKPDTWTTDRAEAQARGYIDDVRDHFKDDDRAKRCKQNADGAIYRPVGETYAACRP